MTYELAKKLKEAGWPQDKKYFSTQHQGWDGTTSCPTLSELIEACGERFYKLVYRKDAWVAYSYSETGNPEDKDLFGKTPEEAVANLWIKLHEKEI